MADLTTELTGRRLKTSAQRAGQAFHDQWGIRPVPPLIYTVAVATGNLGANDKVIFDIGKTTTFRDTIRGISLQIQFPDLDSHASPTLVGKVVYDDGTAADLVTGLTEGQAGGAVVVPLVGLTLHDARVYIEWTTAAATAQAGTIRTLWHVGHALWNVDGDKVAY